MYRSSRPLSPIDSSAVRILDTLCAYPPAQPAVVREGGARVLVAQLASEDESLRRHVSLFMSITESIPFGRPYGVLRVIHAHTPLGRKIPTETISQ